MSNKYLLEIGTEEIPARYVKDALKQIKDQFKDAFNEENINYEDINVYSTPRRLTAIIEGLDDRQEDTESQSRGPSKKIALDEDGNPTKALEGFMRGQGVGIDDIFYLEHNGEEYVYTKTVKKGKDIEEILKDRVPKIIKSVNFPKSMRWGGKQLRFARPIRWIMSILEDKVVPFDLEGIKVSNVTKGHRFLGNSEIKIGNINEYMGKLEENYVILDQEKRKKIIEYSSERLAKETGGKLDHDEELLDEVTNLVEYPTPIIGRIKKEYLNLPKDVVTTTMKEHLRYFPVLDDKDRLSSYFITVRNGNDEYIDNVIKGNEKVLDARLADARFFFQEDISKPLEDYVESLKRIIFQEKLGTLYDKSMRIQKLSYRIADNLGVRDETKRNLERASYLSKADLTTKLVMEFTELQGKMGMKYAEESGENEVVALSIAEQYLPRYAGDDLPSTTAGFILSVADKLDSITGLFAVGIQPTGSQDRFGLRRNALGIINIILDKKINISLKELIDFSLYIYVDEQGLAFNYNEIEDEIMDFFMRRIKNMFSDKGIRYDIIDAVVHRDIDDIYDMKIRANKLSEWLDREDSSEALTAFNRVAKLGKDAEDNEVSRDLLTEDEEIRLYNSFNNIEDEVIEYIEQKEYDEALKLLASLKEPIDRFFDEVMVMVEDEEIKNNRLGLLKKIYNIMMKICDLSKIVNN
ncbi:MAG TPA: glycine--tRNA ligase subunit beta [Tissierellaceae bacterium]|nr:glycine--tRNA ligase subunit beta [Tissierellaceae bacterium]